MPARYVFFLIFTDTLIVASELKDPICHSDECQIGSFSSEATLCEQSTLFHGAHTSNPALWQYIYRSFNHKAVNHFYINQNTKGFSI